MKTLPQLLLGHCSMKIIALTCACISNIHARSILARASLTRSHSESFCTPSAFTHTVLAHGRILAVSSLAALSHKVASWQLLLSLGILTHGSSRPAPPACSRPPSCRGRRPTTAPASTCAGRACAAPTASTPPCRCIYHSSVRFLGAITTVACARLYLEQIKMR